MGQIRVEAIKPCEINDKWAILKPYIDKALSYSMGEMTANEVRRNGVNGEYLFLVFHRDNEMLGVTTVESVVYPTKTIIFCPQVAGKDFDEWSDKLWDVLQNLAKEKNAKEIAIHGRRGWLKKLAPYGFKEQYTTMVSKL